jgi:valyl-tRNA synthetase
MAAMGRDVRLAEDRIAGYQNFVNKLWNASRFVQMNLPADGGAGAPARVNLNLADRWIRSRLASTILEARKAIDAYRFNDYANVLYQFTWHEFCDWYIEMSKLALNSTKADESAKSRKFLRELLDQILLLLHPIMPFVTEEIWQVIDEERKSIMVAPYPVVQASWIDETVEKEMDFLMAVIRAIRNLRTELNCPPGKEVKAVFRGAESDLAFLRAQQPYLKSLARVGAAEFLGGGDRPKGAATAVVDATEIYLPLDDLVNLDEERARLIKDLHKVEDELARVQKKLANADFIAKAKEEVVDKERQKARQFEEKIKTLKGSLDKIVELQAERN